MRILAVATPERLPRYPGVPTLRELVGDYELVSWAGLVGPPNLPMDVVTALAAAFAKASRDPKLSELIGRRGGVQPDPSAAYFARHLAQERQRIERTVVRAGLRLD